MFKIFISLAQLLFFFGCVFELDLGLVKNTLVHQKKDSMNMGLRGIDHCLWSRLKLLIKCRKGRKSKQAPSL